MKKLLFLLVLMVAGLVATAQEDGTVAGQGEMVREKSDLCFLKDSESVVIPKADLVQLLGEEVYGSYCNGQKLYRIGEGLKNGGWAAFGVGLGTGVLGLELLANGGSEHVGGVGMVLLMAGTWSFVAGNAMIPTGYILRGVGAGKINRVANGYNQNGRNTTVSYRLLPSVMRCHAMPEQAKFSVGMTFSVNL